MFQSRQSHSLETFHILSQSRTQLDNTAKDSIRQYLLSQVAPEGGFCNRKGEVDLYYTFFGLICSVVLDVDLPLNKLKHFLGQFERDKLSMIHLTCLAKCRVILQYFKGFALEQDEVEGYLTAMNKFRTPNNSFSYDGRGKGFPYAAFIALNFYQDLGAPLPDADQLVLAIESYRTADRAFRNPTGTGQGMLLSSIAAVQVLRHLADQTDKDALAWIRAQYLAVGGFRATPKSPLPDMLSTAVALFTLKVCGQPMPSFRASCRQFIDDHWDDCGGFRATILDDVCDCEYTYYGLLALGALHDNNID